MTALRPRMPEPGPARRQFRLASGIATMLTAASRLFAQRTYSTPDHIPETGPVIIAAYHASAIDPIIVALHIWERGRYPHFLAKDTLFKGIVGKLLAATGQIRVVRGTDDAQKALQHARAAIERGEAVAIYPEGTLTKDPELWPQYTKSGTARLALTTGAPVIPLAHWGAQEVMPQGSKLPIPRPAEQVRVRTGPPVDLSDLGSEITTENLQKASDRITAAIAVELAVLRNVDVPERFRGV